MTAPADQPSLEEILDGFSLGTILPDRSSAYTKAEALQAINNHQIRMLERIKEEMKQHTVPEGHDLITRSYLNNTIDFVIATLKGEK